MRAFKKIVLFLSFVLLSLAAGCRKEVAPEVAFYYWKTRFTRTTTTDSLQNRLQCRKLYLRLCDLGWDEERREAVPQDALQVGGPLPEKQAIIPVVFIEQPVLQRLSADTLVAAPLAQNLARYLEKSAQLYQRTFTEIQIDCDWTSRTAAGYFRFLQHLRIQPFLSGKTLSVTLRLHQVKYVTKAGIPPADRCMLMCYNLGTFKTLDSKSSILDLPTAKDYLENLDAYPLPLDLALPIFRWTLWYRNNRLLGILRDVNPEKLTQYAFLKSEKNSHLYTCTQDTSLQGYALQQGDVVKAEMPLPDEVSVLARYATERMPHKPYTVVFYHLDPHNLTLYDGPQLEKILRHCR